jgi:hypothetical protein
MPGTFALVCTFIIDASAQNIGNCHAGIGLAGLAADQRDLTAGVFVPKRFGGSQACGAGTNDDVLHDFHPSWSC